MLAAFLLRSCIAALGLVGTCACMRGEDWPQFRGPLGQGTTTAKNLPPAPGFDTLKVLWQTPIPGEGCSSPIVSGGRVYLTTAYEGTQKHPWDEPASWAAIVLALGVIGLAIMRVIMNPRNRSTSSWGLIVYAWTVGVVVLTAVVLAKPRWVWQFADPWTGTTVAAAELPGVETLHGRPALVLLVGTLLLIFINLTTKLPLLATWLRVTSFAVAVVSAALLGLIGGRADGFFAASQPWLAWLVTGGVGFFAVAGSLGFLAARSPVRLLVAVSSFALAGWLFCETPSDEFAHPLSLHNRIAFLVPGLLVLSFHVAFFILARKQDDAFRSTARPTLSALTCLLTILLAGVVFVRSNYLEPQSGVVRAVVCLDADHGHIVWTTPVYVAAAEKKHSLNSLATPTPACDSERVYAYFGSALAALDLSGRVLWLKRDDDYPAFIRYGAGSSVVLADDRILIYRDSEFVGHGDYLDDDILGHSARRPTALVAYDKKSGAEVWNVAPPFAHDSYMTPLVWQHDGQGEVVIATWKTLAGFALADGTINWTHAYPMQQVVPSPAIHGDLLFVSGGHKLPCPMVAIRAPGDDGPAKTIWSNGKTGSNIVSPLCWEGLLFSVSHVGVITCRDAETGRVHWTERLSSRALASLVAGDGKVFALDQEGTLQVFAADTSATTLATHAFGESCSATPALTPRRVYVRTARQLYCLASGE